MLINMLQPFLTFDNNFYTLFRVSLGIFITIFVSFIGLCPQIVEKSGG